MQVAPETLQEAIRAARRVLIREGRVCYFTEGRALAAARTSCDFHILKEDTGEALYSSKDGEFGHATADKPDNSILGQFWLVEARMPDAWGATGSGAKTKQAYCWNRWNRHQNLFRTTETVEAAHRRDGQAAPAGV